MRRLLIKLVAMETMLVGWLSYWIFLIYANNPTVSAGLGDQLSRFPQLAFTTVDIAVLVIIAAFAIMLAFKFHRGLRPGIRLERALQMLENLMKRNLVLEAQVAELRVEKVDKIRPSLLASSSTSSGLIPRGGAFSPSKTPPAAEPAQGSWEKAFRTPLEAGPPVPKGPNINASPAPFENQTGVPPPRVVATPPTLSPLTMPVEISEKPVLIAAVPESKEKLSFKSTETFPVKSTPWEDSPKYVGETTGILNPSSDSKKLPPDPGLKQPYIPIPAPKAPPPSVIVGPMNQKLASANRQAPKPIVRPSFSRPSPKDLPSPLSVETKPANPPIIIDQPASDATQKSETTKITVSSTEEETKRSSEKSSFASKKKPTSNET